MHWSLFWMCVFLTGCNLAPFSAQVAPTATATVVPSNPETADWQTLASGLEERTYRTEEGFVFEAVRIDPTQYTFRAHYRPGEPLKMNAWRDLLPDAALIVNANFFAVDNTIQGLLISDGVAYGRSYTNRGGTFFVANDEVGIRSNIQQPYQGEAYEQAIQAFPMLVFNGLPAYHNSRAVRPSRRTIIGQDEQGRIILMVTPGFGPGLFALSQYLPTTDIDFVHAFNLDGGGSTMLYRSADDYTLPSFDPVPAVLAVYPR